MGYYGGGKERASDHILQGDVSPRPDGGVGGARPIADARWPARSTGASRSAWTTGGTGSTGASRARRARAGIWMPATIPRGQQQRNRDNDVLALYAELG